MLPLSTPRREREREHGSGTLVSGDVSKKKSATI